MSWDVILEWDGRIHQEVGVDVSLREDLNLFGDPAGYRPRSVDVDVLLPWDCLAWIRAGHGPTSAHVTLTHHGVEVLDGAPVTSIVPGLLGELTRIKVEEKAINDRSLIPGRTEALEYAPLDDPPPTIRYRGAGMEAYEGTPGRVQSDGRGGVFLDQYIDTALSNYEATGEGRSHVLVFGTPGSEQRVSGLARATPAYVVEDLGTAKIEVHGGRSETLGSVRVHGKNASGEWASYTGTTYHWENGAGRVVTVVDWDSPLDQSQCDHIFISWNGTARSNLPGDAAGLVRYFLGQTVGVRADWASVHSFSDRLAGYIFAGCIREQVSAWRMLTEVVLPLLPVALVPTPRGVGLAWQPVEISMRDQVCVLHGATSVSARGPYRLEGEDRIVNDLSVRYNPDISDRGVWASTRVGADTHSYAATSALRYGHQADSVDWHWIGTKASADRIASDILRKRSSSRLSVDVELDPELWDRGGSVLELKLGDAVIWMDPDTGSDAFPAIVSRIRRENGRLGATLTMF